jgi:hypothetical protein
MSSICLSITSKPSATCDGVTTIPMSTLIIQQRLTPLQQQLQLATAHPTEPHSDVHVVDCVITNLILAETSLGC